MLTDFLAHPDVEERSILRSRFGFCALHGGLEQNTAEIATLAAADSDASIYAVVQPDDLEWHVPSRHYDPAASATLAAFIEHVDVVVSIHGYGGVEGRDDRWTTALIGGTNRELANSLARRLRVALPEYTWLDELDRMPAHLRGVHPTNPVNMARGAGVQLELPPRVRGFGRFWRDFHGPGFPTHTIKLVEALAAIARSVEPRLVREADHDDSRQAGEVGGAAETTQEVPSSDTG